MMSLYLSIGAAVLGAGALIGWALKRKKEPASEKAIQTNPFSAKLRKLQAGDLSKLEETLLEGDLGAATTEFLLGQIKKAGSSSGASAKEILSREMIGLLNLPDLTIEGLLEKNHPLVISVVGINGAGKTTTIGKLANHFKSAGKKVLLGAGDTFRAGAIAQLKTWADRVGVDFVTGREGADPGAVAFDSVAAGKARGMDVVLLDTAGRLHTKSNLMEELKKIHKVVKKVIPEAPHETWLVLDGTLGQNSLNQAKEFQQSLGLTGLIVTKLDGTAKGGALFPVSRELSLPVRFVGVGEAVEDLIPFDPEKFVQAILG
jgi:fused signal recognition particle receptor